MHVKSLDQVTKAAIYETRGSEIFRPCSAPGDVGHLSTLSLLILGLCKWFETFLNIMRIRLSLNQMQVKLR